ncbi:MAG: DNA cytosine methyltransferase [Nitrososphaerota archaeon]|nr:DNA cytosine methyltransferase [Nitrososphaerota archaeon]
MDKLKVIDLFCGAGGFSEGFRQAGFEVTHAVDNWNFALAAHKANQPEAEVVKADLEKEFLTEEEIAARFPKPDVIIGGPPCTEFSGSKRGGSGDVAKGMKLVLAFFRFVHTLKPRWWVMENVPRLLQTLPDHVKLKEMGVPEEGRFEIPRREVFNSADFGAPQKRLRLLSGRYPSPVQTHSDAPTLTLDNVLYQPWVPMRKVVDAFPNPIGRVPKGKVVEDPNYPEITLKAEELEDHFLKPEEALMSEEEAARNKRQKVAHAYYGKMNFPDVLDRPARTVMATQFNASRETMVIATKYKGETRFRKPTVRECASFQTYPITYRFPGQTLATKYRLVGNSVPVFLSRAIAKAILAEAGEDLRKTPLAEIPAPRVSA